jgi:hypothetical protein
VFALDLQGVAHRVRFARNPPLFVGLAAIEQNLIQLL